MNSTRILSMSLVGGLAIIFYCHFMIYFERDYRLSFKDILMNHQAVLGADKALPQAQEAPVDLQRYLAYFVEVEEQAQLRFAEISNLA